MYKNVHSTIINNSLKVEPAQESIKSGTATLCYIPTMKSVENYTDLTTATCNMDEPHRHSDEQKKPDPQE